MATARVVHLLLPTLGLYPYDSTNNAVLNAVEKERVKCFLLLSELAGFPIQQVWAYEHHPCRYPLVLVFDYCPLMMQPVEGGYCQ